jgi:hypothetical protein
MNLIIVILKLEARAGLFKSLKHTDDVRFVVFTAVTMKNFVFGDVAPCRFCVNRRFGGTAATCSRWFLARGFFYPEDGGDACL